MDERTDGYKQVIEHECILYAEVDKQSGSRGPNHGALLYEAYMFQYNTQRFTHPVHP